MGSAALAYGGWVLARGGRSLLGIAAIIAALTPAGVFIYARRSQTEERLRKLLEIERTTHPEPQQDLPFEWSPPTFMFFFLLLTALAAPSSAGPWKTLAPGMELRELDVSSRQPGGRPVVVLRMDPARWELTLVGRGGMGEEASRTAREWAGRHRLAAAINAGMYATDGATHVGYMECDGKVRSKKVNAYRSVAAFSPRRAGEPPFRLFDVQGREDLDGLRSRYACLVQNLRLVARPGESRWGPQPKKWSEAALGEDRQGRILFLFSPTPFSMHDLIEALLASGLGLVAAQHLEGGAPSQLYIQVDGFEREMAGSLDTGLPIPHVLGVRPRSAPE
jgi:uncharacterized protein YigE (DUF2233 family)